MKTNTINKTLVLAISAGFTTVALVAVAVLLAAPGNKSAENAFEPASSAANLVSIRENTSDAAPFSYLNALSAEQLNSIQSPASDADIAIDFSDPSELKKVAPIAFLATVQSIDGASDCLEGQWSYTQTYGTLNLVANLGDSDLPNTIDFARSGGVTTVADTYKCGPADRKVKPNELRANAGLPLVEEDSTLIRAKLTADDVEIKAGDTYLFHALYNPAIKRYEITGLGYGALKLIDQNGSAVSASDLRSANQSEWNLEVANDKEFQNSARFFGSSNHIELAKYLQQYI